MCCYALYLQKTALTRKGTPPPTATALSPIRTLLPATGTAPTLKEPPPPPGIAHPPKGTILKTTPPPKGTFPSPLDTLPPPTGTALHLQK